MEPPVLKAMSVKFLAQENNTMPQLGVSTHALKIIIDY
jgi:hypothetical protein